MGIRKGRRIRGRAGTGGLAVAVILVVLVCGPAGGSEGTKAKTQEKTAVTIYSTASPGSVSPEMYRPLPGGTSPSIRRRGKLPGYAVVRQERELTLADRRTTVRFSDVAAYIDPTTVSFTSLSDSEGTHVVEQSYEFDLVSTDRLMERYIDRRITVAQQQGNDVALFEGRLLSTSGGLVIEESGGGIRVIRDYSSVMFPSLPGGIMTRPTLVWEIEAARPGRQLVRVTYETGGITWWTDYNVVLHEKPKSDGGISLDMGAWVSIINASGATYRDARLKLVAGNVHRAAPAGMARGYGAEGVAMMAERKARGFEEKPFFEYHLYTLGRRTTLADNATKQIELFPAVRGIPCEKVLVYEGAKRLFRGFVSKPVTDRNAGAGGNHKVDVFLRFKNGKESGLGIPLPAGRVRVSKMDPDDRSLEFIGEDTIDHTAKDEEVRVHLGSAFDVVGERRQTDFKVDTVRKWMDEEFLITLRNHKEDPVRVIVREPLYRWTNWKVVSKSDAFERVDARTIDFPVQVTADGEKEIRYRVRYTW